VAAALRGGSAFFEMNFLSAISLRLVRVALGTSICGLGISVAATGAGCLAAYPPDLPEVPAHRPTILPDESPEIDVPMVEWPSLFIANVEIDPGQSFVWGPFLDYDPIANPNPAISPVTVPPQLGDQPVNVSFSLAMPPDGLCHRIDLLVADAFGRSGPFSLNYFHTPSPEAGVGGDIVTWWYTGGLGLGDCSSLFGGSLPEGGFPFDAPTDSPPPVPE
jgi:hypothetical protein